MRIRISDRHSRIARQLAFDADWRLNDVRRAHGGTDLLNGLLCLKCRDYWNRRNGRKEIRIRDDVLLLDDSVVAFCCKRVRQRKAIVEDASARTDYCFQL